MRSKFRLDLPEHVAWFGKDEAKKWPQNNITEAGKWGLMYKHWNSQNQKNMSIVPSLSNPTTKKYWMKKTTEDNSR